MTKLNRRNVLIGTAGLVSGGAAGLTHLLFECVARAATPKPAIGAWGFDLAGMDRSVNPGDDFFRYAGGTWMKTTQIPPDRSRWGSFDELRAKSEEDVRAAVEDAAKSSPAATSADRKAVDYYRAYLDTAAIEDKGLTPAKADLVQIAAAKTHEDIVAFAVAGDKAGSLPIGIGVTLDAKRPDVYVVGVRQSGLGMPDRDYYLKDDPKFAEARTKYRAYVEMVLSLAVYSDAAKRADEIVAVEHEIAVLHWPRDKSRDRDLTYNPKSAPN